MNLKLYGFYNGWLQKMAQEQTALQASNPEEAGKAKIANQNAEEESKRAIENNSQEQNRQAYLAWSGQQSVPGQVEKSGPAGVPLFTRASQTRKEEPAGPEIRVVGTPVEDKGYHGQVGKNALPTREKPLADIGQAGTSRAGEKPSDLTTLKTVIDAPSPNGDSLKDILLANLKKYAPVAAGLGGVALGGGGSALVDVARKQPINIRRAALIATILGAAGAVTPLVVARVNRNQTA